MPGECLAANFSTLEAKVITDCANAWCVYLCAALDCAGVVLVHFWKYHSVFERRHVCDKALDFPAAASVCKEILMSNMLPRAHDGHY